APAYGDRNSRRKELDLSTFGVIQCAELGAPDKESDQRSPVSGGTCTLGSNHSGNKPRRSEVLGASSFCFRKPLWFLNSSPNQEPGGQARKGHEGGPGWPARLIVEERANGQNPGNETRESQTTRNPYFVGERRKRQEGHSAN